MALVPTIINPNATLAAGGLEGATDDVVTMIFWNRFAAWVFAVLGTAGYIGCQATTASSQSVANTTQTFMPFAAELFDSNPVAAMHDPASNNTRIVMQMTGVWHVTAKGIMDSNATGWRQIGVRMNGSTVIFDKTENAVNGNTHDFCISFDWQFNNATDYIELFFHQTSGGSLNVTTASLSAVKA